MSADRDPVTIDSAGAALSPVLESLDGAENYVGWICSMCQPWLGDHVLEVGAGTGTFTARWSQGRTVTALEPFEAAADRLRERVAGHDNITVVAGGIEDYKPASLHGCAVLVNVLEHLPDDRAAVREICELLEPAANIILYVPAYQWLMSDFDRSIGRFRLYTKRALRELATATECEIADMRSVNFPGMFAWFLVARLGRKDPTSARFAATYDRFFVPALRFIESRLRPPFGQSIFCVLTTSGEASRPAHRSS